MKIGRNELCPCGSGKKYKRCCLGRMPESKAQPQFLYFEDDLDELNNRAVDLTNAGRFEEAEALCQELLKRYPEEVDGLERLAMLWEARGDKVKALAYFRQAHSFATLSGRIFPDSINWYKEQVVRLEAEA